MTPLRLYVWQEWNPDYSDGLAFAVAFTEEEAKEAIIKKHGYNPSMWGPVTVVDIGQGVAFAVSGGS